MLRVGRRTAISTKKYFTVRFQRGNDYIRGTRHLVRMLFKCTKVFLNSTKIKQRLLVMGEGGKRLGHDFHYLIFGGCQSHISTSQPAATSRHGVKGAGRSLPL